MKITHQKLREIQTPIVSSLIYGFAGEIELRRTQTIMEGAKYCDFRFEKK